MKDRALQRVTGFAGIAMYLTFVDPFSAKVVAHAAAAVAH